MNVCFVIIAFANSNFLDQYFRTIEVYMYLPIAIHLSH